MKTAAMFLAMLVWEVPPLNSNIPYWDQENVFVWCPPVPQLGLDGGWHRGRVLMRPKGCVIGFNGGWIVPLNWPSNWVIRFTDKKPHAVPGAAEQRQPLRWPQR